MDNSNLLSSCNRRPTLRLAPLALALTAAFTGSQAFASSIDTDSNAQSANEIERIYVTASTTGNYSDAATKSATKMILSLKETPQSVSVITQQQLEDWKSVNIKDVLQHTTGVYANSGRSHDRTQFIVRGDNVNLIQIDGVQQFPGGRRADVNGDSIAYERVEILRGANGLMTGVGSPTATINLVRKRAVSKEVDGHVGVLAGRWNNNRVELDVSAPLSSDGSIRGRVAAAHYDKDSFVDRYGQEKTSVYVTAEGDLTDTTLIRVGYEYADTASRGVINSHAAPYYFADGSLFNPKRSDTGLTAKNSSWPLEENTYFASISHGFDNGWQLNSIATYNTIDMEGGKLFFLYENGYYNQDGFTDDGFGMSAVISSSNDVQRTFDINLQGSFEFLGQEHDLIVGYNSFDRERTYIGNSHEQEKVQIGDIEKINYFTWNGDIPHYPFSNTDPNRLETHISSGFYFATRLAITENLKTIIGARRTDWEYKEYGQNAEKNGVDVSSHLVNQIEKETTPYAGVIYDINDEYSIYASYSDAFEPQLEYDKNQKLHGPIIGDSLEAGLKAEIGLLNFSFAVFESNKKNEAIDDPAFDRRYRIEGTRINPTIVVDTGTTRGLEFELSGEVSPGFNIYTGYSYAKTEDQDGLQLNTDVPKQLFNFYTTYQPSDYIENLTVGFGMNWKDGYWVESGRPNLQGRERRDHGSVTLFNLMARYYVTEELSISVNIDNVFDKSYHNDIAPWSGSVTWGEPRNWKLSARYSF
ncbi:hypothetical protein N474_15310 [Pseudoalteromonas luteoviolacea CPMOR-2]|uniref:TonB-dependent siderophore receptor n=1 Tax=Pseudoalteromonas luteoviolacea TaxID=43657 RepID=UPI0007B173D0|nr:TonB-dependent siderophore receptor [Pseudoalteromonas luteoviolacea]KZN55347.1 hypothetical protein N474_15310 [Pseudoalteromonas luteoviolacea CPMOR-2]